MINLVFLLSYVGGALVLFFRKSRFLIVALTLVYLLAYDFVFLQLEQALAYNLVASKTFIEVLLAVLLIFLAAQHVKRKTLKRFDLCIYTIFAMLLFIGLATSQAGLTMALKDARVILLPLIFSFALAATFNKSNTNFKFLIRVYIVATTLIMAFGFYEYLRFDGDYTKTWRYQPLLELKLEQNPNENPSAVEYSLRNQFVRKGNLRVASIFISALDYAFFLGFFAVFIFNYFLLNKNPLLLILFFLSVFAIYTTNVRTGFLILMLGLFLSYTLSSRIRPLYKASFLVPFLAAAGSLLYIASGGALNDPSTLGRLSQYKLFLQTFSPIGDGLGSHPAQFDSYYIYTALTFGLASVFLFYFFYMFTRRLAKLHNRLRRQAGDRYQKLFVRLSLTYALVNFYVFAFQHSAGSVNYFLVPMFALISISSASSSKILAPDRDRP